MKIVIMLPKTKITGLKEISKRKHSLTHTLSTHPHTCAQTQAEAGGVTYKLLTWASFFQINNSINKNSNDIQKEKFARVKISTKGK